MFLSAAGLFDRVCSALCVACSVGLIQTDTQHREQSARQTAQWLSQHLLYTVSVCASTCHSLTHTHIDYFNSVVQYVIHHSSSSSLSQPAVATVTD